MVENTELAPSLRRKYTIFVCQTTYHFKSRVSKNSIFDYVLLQCQIKPISYNILYILTNFFIYLHNHYLINQLLEQYLK